MLSCVFGGPASWQASPLAQLRKRLEIYVLQMSNKREVTCTRVLRSGKAHSHTLGKPSRENMRTRLRRVATPRHPEGWDRPVDAKFVRVPTPNSILLGSASKGPGCAGPRSRGAPGEHPVTPGHLLIRGLQPRVERKALGAAQ